LFCIGLHSSECRLLSFLFQGRRPCVGPRSAGVRTAEAAVPHGWALRGLSCNARGSLPPRRESSGHIARLCGSLQGSRASVALLCEKAALRQARAAMPQGRVCNPPKLRATGTAAPTARRRDKLQERWSVGIPEIFEHSRAVNALGIGRHSARRRPSLG
jgi:hypothetical protein